MRSATLLLAILLLMPSCGGGSEAVPSAAALAREGETHLDNALWARAAERFGLAYAVVDPVPEQAAFRGELAFRRGQALARAGFPHLALRWLERAERLSPELFPVAYERGRLLDGTWPDTVDRPGARRAYRAFLEAWEAVGRPEPHAPAAEDAQRALERLGTD